MSFHVRFLLKKLKLISTGLFLLGLSLAVIFEIFTLNIRTSPS